MNRQFTSETPVARGKEGKRVGPGMTRCTDSHPRIAEGGGTEGWSRRCARNRSRAFALGRIRESHGSTYLSSMIQKNGGGHRTAKKSELASDGDF